MDCRYNNLASVGDSPADKTNFGNCSQVHQRDHISPRLSFVQTLAEVEPIPAPSLPTAPSLPLDAELRDRSYP
ncbi:hypothetical protein SUGI_1340880 [Cryptomeria japonica]|uniref:Uncharacterized protein n=1 Tax=Cryptomeria japonica TaxID=3369 RepID=A0AAD3NL67_CRYJA|nr:hypothetical protein SUGI_1340880 [Cryptomeria japonica]